LLVLLFALPGFPPLLEAGLAYVAKQAGYRLEAGRVRGYALFGLDLADVKVEGPGLSLSAKRVGLDYQLLGLFTGTLPLKLELRGVRAELDPGALLKGGEGGGEGGGVRPVLTGLLLEDVRIRSKPYAPWSLPEVELTVSGEGPYRFTARLPGGEVQGEFDLDPGLTLHFKAPATAFTAWYPEILGGEISGRIWLDRGGLRGEGRVEDGRVRVVGFLVEEISGDYRLFPDRLEASLKGFGLEGPVNAEAWVSWKEENYRFTVDAEPTWRAVAAHFGALLPLEGQGRLKLFGEGWEKLRVAGRFSGTPRLFGYALPTEGELSYQDVFRLSARSQGRFYDRNLTLDFALSGEDWVLRYRDEKKSHLVLKGKGPRAEGGGELALPEPLKGKAQLKTEINADRWQTRVVSEGVELLGFKPFSLSGTLSGEGERVRGRLGPLSLEGRWSDLQIHLDPLPMQVGTLSGELRYRGHFFGRLDYTSPFLTLPIKVTEEGGRWRFRAPGARADYEDGVFTLRLEDLSLRLGETLRLSGEAQYRDRAWDGRFEARGRHLVASARLVGQEAEIQAALLGPYGPLRLTGGYAGGKLRLKGEGFSLGYEAGTAYFRGRLLYGPFRVEGDLGYDGRFRGEVWAWGPELTLHLFARDGELFAESQGVLELSGRLWPEPTLSGRFNGYAYKGIELLPQPVSLKGTRLQLGEGFWDLKSGRFALSQPLRLWGQKGQLSAQGDLEKGWLELRLPDLGAWVAGEGPWDGLSLAGAWPKGRLWLTGELDAKALSYHAELRREGVGGSVWLWGQGASVRYAGRLVSGGPLELSGDGRGFELKAQGFSLSPFGVSGRLDGVLGFRARPFADFRAEVMGHRLLAAGEGTVAFKVLGPWVKGGGTLTKETLDGRFAIASRYAEGEIGVRAGPEGVRAEGEGTLRIPGFEPARERLVVENARWRLSGPVALSGEGARYRGEVRLKGVPGLLEGKLTGEGVKAAFEGKLRMPRGESAVWAELLGRSYALKLATPGGTLVFKDGVLETPGLDLGPLFSAWGLSGSGRVEGRLGGGGLLKGEARLYGQSLRFALRKEGGVLWWPSLDAGLRLRFKDGVLARGIGRLRGALAYAEGRWQGELWLRGLPEGRFAVSGPGARPRWQALLRGEGFRLAAEGEGARYALKARWELPYAEGNFALSGEGARYRGRGWLKTRQGVLQEGPLAVEGEGAALKAAWEAPLAVRYQEGRLWLAGEAALAGGGRLAGRLSYRRDAGFSGRMELFLGELSGVLSGEGALRARLSYPGGEAQAVVGPGLDLGGEAHYRTQLLKSTLIAEAKFSGTLWDPVVLGQGVLEGEGAKLPFAFGYRKKPWARAEAEGLWLRLDGRFLGARAEGFDLSPYLGLGLRINANGAGDLKTLALPVGVLGYGGALWGTLRPASGELALSGSLWGGEAALWASPEAARLVLDTRAPRAKGELRWQRGAGFSGAIELSSDLPGGKLLGRLDGEGMRLALSGEGALSGTLSLDLLARRAEGALRYRVGTLGEVRILGEGPRVALKGEGQLAPLWGRIDLERLRLFWRYRGPLPAGIGRLEALGQLPGRWLFGKAWLLGRELELLGEGASLRASGEGVQFEASSSGLKLRLQGLALGPVRLTGGLEGDGKALHGRIAWEALGRSGEVELKAADGLLARFTGALRGELWVGAEGWRGSLSGEGLALRFLPPFKAEGEIGGEPFALDLARKTFRIGGLKVRYPWSFEGRARLFGLDLIGEGDAVRAERLGFFARIVPSPFAVEFGHRRGEGALCYEGGRFSGELSLTLGGLALAFKGEGERVRLSGTAPALPELDLPAGRIEGEADVTGRWRLFYQAGEVRFVGEGRGASGQARLDSPYGGGTLFFEGGLRGDLILRGWPFYGDRLDFRLAGERAFFRLEGPLGAAEGWLRFAGYRLAEGGAEIYALDASALPELRRVLPYLKGRIGGVWRYQEGSGFLQIGSAGIGDADEAYPFAFTLRYGDQTEGRLVWDGLKATFARDREGFRFQGEARDFPLDLPVRLAVGPVEGGVRFTGRFAGGGPEPWLLVAGERVRLYSDRHQMTGEVSLAYEGRTLRLDRFSFRGDGRMEGRGSWTLGKGGDLWLEVENADFSPLLMLDPRLARWRPRAGGDLRLKAQGARLEAEGRGRLELKSVDLEIEGFSLAYDAADDRFKLSAEARLFRPVESRFRLEGSGGMRRFALRAWGDLNAPLLQPLPEVEASFVYPEGRIEAQTDTARLEGTLWPLDLTLNGVLPIAYPRYYLTAGEARSVLRLRLQNDGLYHLSGEVEVLKALVALPEERPKIQESKKEPFPLVFEAVHIYADDGVVLNNPLAQGEAAGDLYLGGTAADPYLAGRAWALWGNFLLLNHRFEVEEAWARFSPELGIYPELYLRARADTPEGPLYLLAEGRFVRQDGRAELVLDTCLAEEAVTELSACKLLPQEGAAARLLGLGQGQLAEQVLEVAIKNLLIGQLESELAKSLGLDLFRFETGAFEGEGLESTRFTVGKYLSPELFLAYRYDFAEGSRIYASYRHGEYSLTFATDLSPDPNPEFSLTYAFTSDLSAYLRLAEDRFELGLEWRP